MDKLDTEVNENTEVESKQPQLDEVKLSELIKKGLKDSFDELTNDQRNSQQSTQQSTQTQSTDPWDEVLEPRIRKGTQQSNSIAAAAEDKVDFYTSDYWLKEIDEILPGDDTEDGKVSLQKAKKEIRDTLETTFSNLLKQGRGIPRSDIVDFAVGQYVKKNKSTYTEGLVKKSSLQKEKEVQKARRGVDIQSGNISNFSPEQLHNMPQDKINEQFGGVLF